MKRIVGVALDLGDGTALTAPAPKRHHHLIHRAHNLGVADRGPDAQGFVTSDGFFVDRTDAYFIAKEAGQLVGRVKHGPPTYLFSEDLW